MNKTNTFSFLTTSQRLRTIINYMKINNGMIEMKQLVDRYKVSRQGLRPYMLVLRSLGIIRCKLAGHKYYYVLTGKNEELAEKI